MAHRVNVTPVQENISISEDEKKEMVRDPVCGMTIPRYDAKYMLFRGDETWYFCSKECQEKFIHPVKTSQKKVA